MSYLGYGNFGYPRVDGFGYPRVDGLGYPRVDGFGYPRVDGFGYPGFGAASPPLSYGQNFGSVIQEVTSRSDIMANLSPPVRGTVQAMRMSMEKELGKSLSSVIMPNVPGPAIDAIAKITLQTINLVTGTVTASLVGTSAAEIVGTVADIIPFISGLVQFVVGALSKGSRASGVGECADDINLRAAYCQAQYAPVHGSGEQNSPIYACDFFTNTSANAYGERRESSVGMAFEIVTEPEYYWAPPYKFYSQGIAASSKPSWLKPGLGIPSDIQKLFKKMRIAMRDSCADPSLDGGNSLFPIYLDLLRVQFQLGRMNRGYAKYLYNMWHDDICGGAVGERAETCYTHEKRGIEQVLGLLEGWQNTIVPKHDPGGKKAAAIAASEGQLVAQANKELLRPPAIRLNAAAMHMLLRKTAPKKVIPNRKPIKRVVFRPKTKMTPAKAVGIGAGAAVVLLFFL